MITMVAFNVDDEFAEHPKVVGLADPAVALWTRAGSWSARYHTDGFVPTNVVARYCARPHRTAAVLVDCGLWEVVEGGYRFHDWPDYNPTRDTIEDRKAGNRERQRRFRVSRVTNAGVTRYVTRDRRVTNAGVTRYVTQGVSNPPPTGGGNPPGRTGGRARVEGGMSTPETPEKLPTSERETSDNATDARRQAEARSRAIAACSRCDSAGYVGTQVCDHGLAGAASAQTRASVMAEIRANLNRPTTPPARSDGAP